MPTDIAHLLVLVEYQHKQKPKDFERSMKSMEKTAKDSGKSMSKALKDPMDVVNEFTKRIEVTRQMGQFFPNMRTDIEVTQQYEKTLRELLGQGLSPLSDEVTMAQRAFEGFHEELQQANGGIAKMGAGLGSAIYPMQAVAFAVQDLPFSVLSGNIISVSNNVPAMVMGFQALAAEAGGLGGALGQVGALLKGPFGIVFLLGSVLPSAIILAQHYFGDLYGSAEKARKKLEQTTEGVEAYISAVKSLSSLSFTDPLSVIEGEKSINALRQIVKELDLANIEIDKFKANSPDLLNWFTRGAARVAASPSYYTGTRDQDALDRLQADKEAREVIESMRVLSEAQEKVVRNTLDEAVARQKLMEVYLKLNPVLKIQHDLSKRLGELEAGTKAGIDASRQALEKERDELERRITAMRAGANEIANNNDLNEDQAKSLNTIIQLINVYSGALDNINGILKDRNEETKEQIDLLDELIKRLDGIRRLQRLGVTDISATALSDAVKKAIEGAVMSGADQDVIDGMLDELNKALTTEMGKAVIPVVPVLAKDIELQRSIDEVVRELNKEFESMERLMELGIFPDFDLNASKADAYRKVIRELNEDYEHNAEIIKEIIRLAKAQGVSFDDTSEKAKKVRLLSDEMGRSFRGAFEDAIFRGNQLRDVLAGLLEDIGRITFRQLVFNPFMDSVLAPAIDVAGGALWGKTTTVNDALITKDGQIIKGHPDDNIAFFKKGGSGDVNVKIINNNGSKISTKVDETGGVKELLILIDKAIDNKLTDNINSGRMDRIFEQNYGIIRGR